MAAVIVTGATGFVGRAVVRSMSAERESVTMVGRREPVQRNTAFRRADLLDHTDITSLIRAERASHLIHLAWDVSDDEYWQSDRNDVWADATIRLGETFAQQGGRRMVVAGTCAENATSLSTTPYARAKVRAQQALSEIDGLEVAWIRIFFPVGPFEAPRRLVPSLIRDLAAGRRFVVRQPSLVRDFCSVVDVGRAFAAAVRSAHAGIYEIGTGTGTTLGEIATKVAALMDRSDLLEFGPDSPPDPLVASIDDLVNDFGWHPARSSEDALADAVKWWTERM